MPARATVIPPCRQRKFLPAVWMRAGTSKGLFIHRHDLPSREEDWAPVLLAAMGSQDADSLQLNGIGGATSTTSKVAIIAPSRRPGVDVDYTFAQVAVGVSSVDMSGNCGNVASGVGPFAVEEGLVQVEPGQSEVDVRVYNTNTKRTLVVTVDVDADGQCVENGTFRIPGVHSPGSRIRMSFERPAGSKTGRLLPSGAPVNTVEIRTQKSTVPHQVRISAVDAANPFIFVDETTLPEQVRWSKTCDALYLDFIETVRRVGAVLMGLASSVEKAAATRGTPKIAVVSAPTSFPDEAGRRTADVKVAALTMGKPHSSLQMTGAVPLAVAACVEGTVVYNIAKQAAVQSGRHAPSEGLAADAQRVCEVLIEHPTGAMPVNVVFDSSSAISNVVLSRTARRLFEGRVAYYA